MATITRTEELKVGRPLQPVAAGGWLGGLANLLRKEVGQWWGTKMWWVQLVIWLLILNGITTLVMIEGASSGENTLVDQLHEAVQVFVQLGAMAISIGVITTVQGAIVGEKQLGTAAWVMSKPASRPAFILAKAAAHGLGFGITAVIVPTILFVVETRWLFALPLSLSSFTAGVGLMALSVLFYLTLTLMLGTVFNSRGPIAGIGVGLYLAGVFLGGMFPPELTVVTPWLLPGISTAAGTGTPLPDYWTAAVAFAGAWILVFLTVALWRFSREEF